MRRKKESMGSKILIDANILLDFTLKRAGYLSARALFQLVVDRKVVAYITPSILHIAGYWLTKAYGAAKAKTILQKLLAVVQVIDCHHDTAVLALHSKMTDIEDALQYYTALSHRLDCLISCDKQLKKSAIDLLPVMTPAEWLNHYR